MRPFALFSCGFKMECFRRRRFFFSFPIFVPRETIAQIQTSMNASIGGCWRYEIVVRNLLVKSIHQFPESHQVVWSNECRKAHTTPTS